MFLRTSLKLLAYDFVILAVVCFKNCSSENSVRFHIYKPNVTLISRIMAAWENQNEKNPRRLKFSMKILMFTFGRIQNMYCLRVFCLLLF